MTAANTAIVESFETLGMSPSEIAIDQELDETSVKAILMQFSSIYRKNCGNKEELNFTDEQEQAAIDVIANIARGYTEADENTQLRAAMFLRNDKRGRLDIVKQSAGLNINVLLFNEQMAKAIAAKERSKLLKDEKVIKV